MLPSDRRNQNEKNRTVERKTVSRGARVPVDVEKVKTAVWRQKTNKSAKSHNPANDCGGDDGGSARSRNVGGTRQSKSKCMALFTSN